MQNNDRETVLVNSTVSLFIFFIFLSTRCYSKSHITHFNKIYKLKKDIRMTPQRKKTEEFIIKRLEPLDKSGLNVKRYKEFFASLSDSEFDDYMKNIENGNEVLYLYFANMKDKITIAELRDYAEKIGVKLFERLRIWDEVTKSYYLTPNKYCVLQLPIRRMSQFVDHKMSVPEGDKKIDVLSGQVIKEDKGASISQVEVQSLYAHNLQNTIIELLKYRGGDLVALSEFKRELEEQGKTNISRDTGSIARSVVSMNNLLIGMHIESNIAGNGM